MVALCTTVVIISAGIQQIFNLLSWISSMFALVALFRCAVMFVLMALLPYQVESMGVWTKKHIIFIGLIHDR